jgi:hypothetical protein
MKTLPRLSLLLTLSIFSTIACAQYRPFPDSIKVEFPDQKSIVTFQLRDYSADITVVTSFPSTLANLCEHIKNSIPSTQQLAPHRVDITHTQEGKLEGLVGHERFVAKENSDKYNIVITEPSTQTSLVVKGNSTAELLPPGWEVKIKSKRFIISLYSPDFASMQALSKLDLQPVVSALEKQTADVYLKRKGITSRVIYNGDAVTYSKLDAAPIHDMLGIHIGAGAGLFKGNLYPELNFSTALYFANRHNVLRQRIELGYDLKFFSGSTSESKYDMLTNGFVNLSYSRNFSTTRTRWTGLGIGYLVESKGGIYEGKTMKFFLESDIGNSKINLVPEFYLTNDFKDFNFGLKFQYKF